MQPLALYWAEFYSSGPSDLFLFTFEMSMIATASLNGYMI